MALIKCKECGKEISENATTCPHCGAKNKNNNETASTGVKVICFLIPLVGIIIFAINISTKPKYAKGCLIASLLPTIIILIIILLFFSSNMLTRNKGIINKNISSSNTSSINNTYINHTTNTEDDETCIERRCNKKRADGSLYCEEHKQNIVGTIKIPSVEINCSIYSSQNYDPDKGAWIGIRGNQTLNDIGNTVIYGKNSSNGTLFANLGNVNVGDNVFITDLSNNEIEYIIYDIQQIDISDKSYYDRTTENKEITLLTSMSNLKNMFIIYAKEKK